MCALSLLGYTNVRSILNKPVQYQTFIVLFCKYCAHIQLRQIKSGIITCVCKLSCNLCGYKAVHACKTGTRHITPKIEGAARKDYAGFRLPQLYSVARRVLALPRYHVHLCWLLVVVSSSSCPCFYIFLFCSCRMTAFIIISGGFSLVHNLRDQGFFLY